MKILKKSVPLWVTILAILAVISVAIAAIHFTYQITNQMSIAAFYTLEVWNEDKTELVTTVDWEAFILGTSVEKVVWIKNVGNVDVWPTWNVTDFPSTEFSISGYRWGGSDWIEILPDTKDIFLEPGMEHNFMFKLTCIDEVIADYSFTLNINGNDNT